MTSAEKHACKYLALFPMINAAPLESTPVLASNISQEGKILIQEFLSSENGRVITPQ